MNKLNATIYNTDKFGTLMCAYIGLYYGEPILFICENDKHRYYLFMTISEYPENPHWMITEVSPQVLEQILYNKISICDTFKKCMGTCCVSGCGENPHDLICEDISSSECQKYLPDESLFFFNEEDVSCKNKIRKVR